MERYGQFIVARLRLVLLLTLLLTAVSGAQLRNLTVIVDADELLPRDHPFGEVTERVQDLFCNRSMRGCSQITPSLQAAEILLETENSLMPDVQALYEAHPVK